MIVFEVRKISFSLFEKLIIDLARLFIQLINGILTGSLTRNSQAYHTLKDLLTNSCHLRSDELALILEFIFRYLNRDEDETTNNGNHHHHQQPIKVEEFH